MVSPNQSLGATRGKQANRFWKILPQTFFQGESKSARFFDINQIAPSELILSPFSIQMFYICV
jgi:hypothetical protein